jgi:hypothetical protein
MYTFVGEIGLPENKIILETLKHEVLAVYRGGEV